MKPILYNIQSFDASQELTIHFQWNGNQSFGNICTIKENDTNIIVYQAAESTMQLKHTVPANTLINGKSYNVRIATLDLDSNISTYSDAVLFYCLSTPSFTFDNLDENQIVQNAFYQVTMTYDQIENEPLQSWEITLYDVSKSKIQSSGINYSDTIKCTLINLEDNQNYYIKASCLTLNGMETETEFIPFSVNYKQPAVYSILTLENIKNNGYIKLQSNIRAVEAHSLKNIQYVDEDFVDLTDNTVVIDNDFSLEDDFVINLLGYGLKSNALIMQLANNENVIKMYFRSGIYDINKNVAKAFVELEVPIGFTSYVCFSNYIDIPSNTDMIDIWIKRKNGLYSVNISNKGGQ